ncbi:uncharacterized protein LOC130994238 [Salvia miltiorrhiza]|uniref:uncharacterized protein LOC130994238 n=1 Tax=Salvia miltiorrhiza TaxID=226208 RepID=UPI0025ABB6BA|nr:uncharacterized protein LOC130994238 [Salvia miltiorrhiza]
MSNYSPFFTLRQDATGRNGISPLQKCTAAIRQLAYAAPGDSLDEYMRMGESTALECLHEFCRSMIAVYGDRYLRTPNAAYTERLLQMHEERHGFPGMLGSLDCMHWEWRNCPVAYKGYYTRGDHGVPTIGNAPPVQFTVNGRMCITKDTILQMEFIQLGLHSSRVTQHQEIRSDENLRRDKRLQEKTLNERLECYKLVGQ